MAVLELDDCAVRGVPLAARHHRRHPHVVPEGGKGRGSPGWTGTRWGGGRRHRCPCWQLTRRGGGLTRRAFNGSGCALLFAGMPRSQAAHCTLFGHKRLALPTPPRCEPSTKTPVPPPRQGLFEEWPETARTKLEKKKNVTYNTFYYYFIIKYFINFINFNLLIISYNFQFTSRPTTGWSDPLGTENRLRKKMRPI